MKLKLISILALFTFAFTSVPPAYAVCCNQSFDSTCFDTYPCSDGVTFCNAELACEPFGGVLDPSAACCYLTAPNCSKPVACNNGEVVCDTRDACNAYGGTTAVIDPPAQPNTGGSGGGVDLGDLGVASSLFQGWNSNLFGPNSRIVSFTLAGIINALMPFIFAIAGLALLLMLIAGGFKIMTAVNNPDQADAGKRMITAAIIGFLLLFSSYWIAQALEVIFGINFL